MKKKNFYFTWPNAATAGNTCPGPQEHIHAFVQEAVRNNVADPREATWKDDDKSKHTMAKLAHQLMQGPQKIAALDFRLKHDFPEYTLDRRRRHFDT